MDAKSDSMDTFTFEESCSEISKKIVKESAFETDVSLVCGNTIFRAHKIFLASWSTYILEQFLQQPLGNFTFVLEGVQPLDVENILVFVYEGKINAKASQTPGFLAAAKQLKIVSLVKGLEQLNQVEVEDCDSDAYLGMPTLPREFSYPHDPSAPFNSQSHISHSQYDASNNSKPSSSGQFVTSTLKAAPPPPPILLPMPSIAPPPEKSFQEIMKSLHLNDGVASASVLHNMAALATETVITARNNNNSKISSHELVTLASEAAPKPPTLLPMPFIALPPEKSFQEVMKSLHQIKDVDPSAPVHVLLAEQLDTAAPATATVTTARNKARKPRVATPVPRSLKNIEAEIKTKKIAAQKSPPSKMLKRLVPPAEAARKKVPEQSKQEKKCVLGRPLLSSTKLNADHPAIPDMSKHKQEKLNKVISRFLETIVDDKTNPQKQTAATEKCPVLENAVLENPIDEGTFTVKTQDPNFCLVDLVEKSKVAKSDAEPFHNIYQRSISSMNRDNSDTALMPKNSKIFWKDGKRFKRVFKKKLPKQKPIVSTTFEEAELITLRRKSTHRRKTMTKSAKGTDQSGSPGELRKKLPVAKRRRIPASTRPVIVSSTFSNVNTPGPLNC